jgi:murein DD-endopeptidase MepM/ murein hydrolase activator NlpD
VPAQASPLSAPRGRSARAAALLLVGCLVLTADLVGAPAAEATNWSSRIASVRSSQLYYESAMRGADLQLRSLKHAARRAHRKLGHARRNLAEAKAIRSEALSHHQAETAQLEAARERLARLVEPPATPDDLTSLARLPALSGSDVAAEGRPDQPGSTDEAPDPGPETIELASGELLAPLALAAADPAAELPEPATDPQPAVSVAAELEAAAAAVRRLEQETRVGERAADRARRKVQRVARSAAVKTRSVRSIAAARRSATARRAGAEAGLANAILAMSDLAPRRVANKTDVRLRQGSQFAWPTTGRLVQGYGCTGFYLNPARGSCPHFHDGIDIAGYLGTRIRAAAVGVISYIGWNPWDHRQRAFMVVVAHPGGYETLYGHIMPRRDVRVGQLVRRGELIGYMGSTGKATGVHLHLELRRGRTTLDPLAFL